MPGVATEGETIGRLRERAPAVMSDLLELNADLISPERREGPHHLRLVAYHESAMPVAT